MKIKIKNIKKMIKTENSKNTYTKKIMIKIMNLKNNKKILVSNNELFIFLRKYEFKKE